VLERLDEDLGELLVAVAPDVEQLVVALALGDDAVLVVLLDAVDALLRGVEQLLLLVGMRRSVTPKRGRRRWTA
jgi:hypothetical protein